jgi:hypothetical protein
VLIVSGVLKPSKLSISINIPLSFHILHVFERVLTTCKLYSTLGSLEDYEHCAILDSGVIYDKEVLKKPV